MAFPTYWQRSKVAFQYLMPQLYLTKIAGFFAQRKWGAVTHLIIRLFAKKYGINMQEAAKENFSDYESFNAFFTRPLKADARPICAGENSLCLPADGRVSECGKITDGLLIQAKGHYFSLHALLAGDPQLTELFKNGEFITTYLSPRDYHRVHMPCDATLRKMTYVPGELFSVNPFLAQHIPDLFARNERLICVFDTPKGVMVQILVGATITASMRTTWAGVVNPPRYADVTHWFYDEQNITFKKGDEMGAFELGSTVINLFPANTIELNPALRVGVGVKMGEELGEWRNISQ